MNADGKLPWFPFFPKDWLSDSRVGVMSLAEQGAYMRLLAHCWVDGGIPADSRKLARLVGASEEEFLRWWTEELSQFFSPAPRGEAKARGMLSNRRLEAIREGQRKQKMRLSLAGKKGVAIKRSKTDT